MKRQWVQYLPYRASLVPHVSQRRPFFQFLKKSAKQNKPKANAKFLKSMTTTSSMKGWVNIARVTKGFVKLTLSIRSSGFQPRCRTTLSVNFINILLEAFMKADHKSAKKRLIQLDSIFVLLGSACIKAVHKMLMKWKSNIINFLTLFQAITVINFLPSLLPNIKIDDHRCREAKKVD